MWDDNPTEWSSVQYHDVYHHLIKSPRLFSNEAMENYKSFEAYKFFVSGWVQTVKHMVLLTGVVILKAEVRPLYKTSNQPHQSWLLSTKEDPLLLVTAIA